MSLVPNHDGRDSMGYSCSPPQPYYLHARQHKGEIEQKRKRKKGRDRHMSSDCFNKVYRRTGQQLGKGSVGKVETCINVDSGREFAVKTMQRIPGLYTKSDFMREVEIHYVCEGHPNIIQLIEIFEEPDMFHLVLEKMQGGPLLQQIQTRKCFTEADASRIMKNLAGSLKFMHSCGIAHRDIKPENILYVNTMPSSPVKLCDFDLCSKAYSKLSTPRLYTPAGSNDYMAPEVVETFKADDEDYDDPELYYDKKCDLWSLGVVLFILLCGYPPFTGHCDPDCGCDVGKACDDCEALLFSSIQEGSIIFNNDEWASISTEAKHLILCLLKRDVSSRISAEEVLAHPWIINGGYSTPLETPNNLARQTTFKEVLDFSVSTLIDTKRAVAKQNISELPDKNTFGRDFSNCDIFEMSELPNKNTFGRDFSDCDTFDMPPPALFHLELN